jgi:hypothetical protein
MYPPLYPLFDSMADTYPPDIVTTRVLGFCVICNQHV